jgi:hypothetical protein
MGRVQIDPEKCKEIHHVHYGSGLPVFKGEFRQQGYGLGGLLSGLARTVLPIIAPIAKSLAKTVLSTGLDTGRRIASDVISGKDTLKSSAKKRISAAIDPRKRKHDIFDL